MRLKEAELHQDGGKLGRLEDDETRRAFRVVVELRCCTKVVDEASREDVGVGPGSRRLRSNRMSATSGFSKRLLPPEALLDAFSRAAMRSASASDARSATVYTVEPLTLLSSLSVSA